MTHLGFSTTRWCSYSKVCKLCEGQKCVQYIQDAGSDTTLSEISYNSLRSPPLKTAPLRAQQEKGGREPNRPRPAQMTTWV